ncbi:hypothetical protein C7450_1194 [Chelatococcus asaccharovorans]|jgi:hypothetical protein|uniref:Uncharacterized protein n=1 Tax=Chelatococcus asaccharovorans TaxID=28210 RepID=A0A2V3U3D3_9HYPH|nr:hypothetical protein C7450_1194 [Chelatococcus asaccharovorans]
MHATPNSSTKVRVEGVALTLEAVGFMVPPVAPPARQLTPTLLIEARNEEIIQMNLHEAAALA